MRELKKKNHHSTKNAKFLRNEALRKLKVEIDTNSELL